MSRRCDADEKARHTRAAQIHDAALGYEDNTLEIGKCEMMNVEAHLLPENVLLAQTGHVDLRVRVAHVAYDSARLELLGVFARDHAFIAGGRYDDVDLFDDLLDPHDLEAVHALFGQQKKTKMPL